MIMFETVQDGDIRIQFIYLKRKKEYKVKVKKGKKSVEETFSPAREPEGKNMDFLDLDQATRIANKIYKRLK